MFLKYLLYRLGPKDGSKLSIFGEIVAYDYAEWRERTRQAIMAWHRRELRALDWRFDLEESQRELVRQREAARAQGIKPDDPRYPSLFDIHPLK